MSGFELLEELKKDRRSDHPPVIVYTGRDLTKDEVDKLGEFSDSIIIKGVRSEERLLQELTLFLHHVESKIPPSKRQAASEPVRHREEIFAGKKLLVVDDDMRNVFALRSVFAKKGFEVLVAKTGKEAIDRLNEFPNIDLVLMDIMMPEMDGYEAMRAIRAQKKFEKLPIIALTAKAMASDRDKCLDAGANDYLTKPIDIDQLMSLLRIWLTK
jgi:CheY-like chemotaxis protein